MNSQEVLWALLRHLRSKTSEAELTFIPEFEVKSHGRRLDLLTISNWESHGHHRAAYEIKVTRKDFLNEVKNGTKTNAMLHVANQSFFVCPKDLVKVEEVPLGCGFIEVSSKGCSIVRKSPVKEDISKSPGLLLDFMVQAVRRQRTVQAFLLSEGEASELTAELVAKKEQEAYTKGFNSGKEARDSDRRFHNMDEKIQKLKKYEDAIREALGIGSWIPITDKDIETLLTLKDNSPDTFRRYREKVARLAKELTLGYDEAL